MSRLWLVFPFALSTVVVGCGGDSDSESDVDFYSGTASAALGAPNNEARCSNCHSADGSTSGQSGASLEDIAFRSSYKGGDAPTLIAAANACIGGWMGGTAVTADDDRWNQLEAYLVSISDAAVTTPNGLAPEVLANEVAYETSYAGGNAAAGAAKYATFCAQCHDNALRVGMVATPTKASIKGLSAGRIAQQVRTSGPPPSGMSDPSDSTPGPMPFFEPAELSPQDLKDIIAYVRQ
ncbi:MAG: c-type cytochrome [Deltaproteobacteria bacterium]|nr:c-type cytochrome [Deltaproteobacteria bacterium]